MKTDLSSAPKTSRATEIYRAFRRLNGDKRRHLALRILRDQRVISDLYDHFLIQEALRERGKSTSWQTYRRRKGSPTR